jgi:hypothetical protein
VHAGNENKQQGWRHANPYVQIAEDLLATADSDAQACIPKPQVGRTVSWLIQSTGVMQFGDGVVGNLLCSALLLVLISCFVGLATWGLLVIEQLTDYVFKSKVRASKAI